MAEGRIVVVKTGSTLPDVRARRGDFEDWIAAGLGCQTSALDVVDVSAGAVLPPPAGLAGVVITGSPAFVSQREPWSVRCEEWIAPLTASDLPVLGICYGHQLIAQALGGRVGPNPRGREIGTVEVDLSPALDRADPLLGVLPRTAALHATHVESVLALPPGAERLAASALDPNQAYAVGFRCWGVQFHPEFDADILRGYVDGRSDDLRAEGLDPELVRRGIRDTPHGTALLRRFAEIVWPGRLAARDRRTSRGPWERRFVTVVSGVPRSGTSLVMQMLAAGGVPVLTDAERPADEDNPRGYFEYAPVKRSASDVGWFARASGRAVKVIHALLRHLPDDAELRVLFVQRDASEVLASQRRMLERAGAPSPPAEEAQLAAAFEEQVRAVRAWASARPRTAWLPVEHRALVERPHETAARIDAFLGGGLDVPAMAEQVDPKLHRQRQRHPRDRLGP